jgi:hypothetical protein
MYAVNLRAVLNELATFTDPLEERSQATGRLAASASSGRGGSLCASSTMRRGQRLEKMRNDHLRLSSVERIALPNVRLSSASSARAHHAKVGTTPTSTIKHARQLLKASAWPRVSITRPR